MIDHHIMGDHCIFDHSIILLNKTVWRKKSNFERTVYIDSMRGEKGWIMYIWIMRQTPSKMQFLRKTIRKKKQF
jgi:hypothetical protein